MKSSGLSQHFTVRLNETDLGGIVHHSNYFHWIEETEYAFFDSIGESVVGQLDEQLQGSGWPRSEFKLKFLKPLKFRDNLRVDLQIQRIRSAGIQYSVQIFKTSEDLEELVLKGTYSAIHCLYDATQRQDPRPLPIPEHFLKKIQSRP